MNYDTEARAALARLVELKDGPRDSDYEAAKVQAWAQARAVLDPNREAQLQAAMKAIDLAGCDPAEGMTLRTAAAHLLDDGHLDALVALRAPAASAIKLLLDGKVIHHTLLKRKRNGGIELGLA